MGLDLNALDGILCLKHASKLFGGKTAMGAFNSDFSHDFIAYSCSVLFEFPFK
jgi:hypothetical protein